MKNYNNWWLGFIGTNIIKKLIKKIDIYVVDNKNLNNKNNLYIYKKKKNFTYINLIFQKKIFIKNLMLKLI